MPVTPITPAQIDEVGKGACLTAPGSHPSDQAASHLGGDAVSIPSRGRFVNGVEDLPSEDDMIERGMIALPDSVRYDIEREARSLVNVFVPDAPPALLQGIEAALFRAEKRRIADLKRERASAFAAANPSGGIDDAIALVKREFPGWAYALDECHLDIHAWICPDDGTPSNGYDGWGETMALAIVDAVKNAKEALGAEARSAETGTGSVEDEGPADSSATPSIPPSPRKGQEENPRLLDPSPQGEGGGE